MAVSRVTTDPVCNLIGGSGRRQVLAVMEVAAGTPDGMARQCAEWVEQGVRGFKAKVGAIPEDDVERLAAIRAAVGPKIMLRADANQGYTPREAIRLCRMCERLDLLGSWNCWSSRFPSGISPAWRRCGPRWT